MNWRYSLDPQSRTFLVSADGLIVLSELHAGARILMTDPQFTPDAHVLLDFSRAEEFQVPAAGLCALGALPAFSADSRRAVLVREGFASGIFQIWASHALPRTAKVFHDRTAAVAWLNQDRPPEAALSMTAALSPGSS